MPLGESVPDPIEHANGLPNWPEHFAPKVVRFHELARCGDEIWIEHEGKLYRLQRTRQGKLILTK